MSARGSREIEVQLEAMAEGAVDFYGRDELAERLREGQPLRVKLGMDPTAPDLHLGHTVVLGKLKRFQELGHQVIFLVGDFTARIGDPSGRNKTRPPLDEEAIQRNAGTYVDQVRHLLDVGRGEQRFNSEWMQAMGPADFIRLCASYTVARLLERDDFQKRYAAGEPISVHEFLYPFVQAYDSVALEADVELGGTDQTFNLLMGREVQRAYGQRPQAVITHPLLVGTDGADKMSKSVGNTVGITDPPVEMYGKVMSISDALMVDWVQLLAAGEWPALLAQAAEVEKGAGDPLATKQALAAALVERFHGAEAASEAAAHFRRVVQRKELPDDIPAVRLNAPDGDRGLLDLLRELGFARSNSEARRLVLQGGVQVEGTVEKDAARRLPTGSYLIRAGKRRFARVELV